MTIYAPALPAFARVGVPGRGLGPSSQHLLVAQQAWGSVENRQHGDTASSRRATETQVPRLHSQRCSDPPCAVGPASWGARQSFLEET